MVPAYHLFLNRTSKKFAALRNLGAAMKYDSDCLKIIDILPENDYASVSICFATLWTVRTVPSTVKRMSNPAKFSP